MQKLALAKRMRDMHAPSLFEDPIMITAHPASVAEAVLENHLGRVNVDAITAMTGGLVNHVFDYNDQFVVRICGGERALATFQKEKWCIETAASIGVKTPVVLSIDYIDHYATMLLRKVRGTLGCHATGQFADIWRRLGQFAALINSRSVDGVGKSFLSNDPSGSCWDEWIGFQRSHLFSDPKIWLDCLSSREIDVAQQRFEHLGELKFSPRLCHGNIGLRNVVVDKDQNVYLLDWGNAGGFPWYWDLGEVMAWHKAEHGCIKRFCEGYGIRQTDLEQTGNELICMMTWRWLSSIHWAREQGGDWRQRDFVRLSVDRLKQSSTNPSR